MSAFRLFNRTDGIATRRMAVRPDVPWYWRWLQIGGATVAVVSLGWMLQALGQAWRPPEPAVELARLHERMQQQEDELAALRPRVAEAQRQMQIDRAAAADLEKQVKSLAFENAALKEDLAFFQSLMETQGGATKEGSISVNRFRLKPESVAGEYRYQMLLVQTGQRVREFSGTVQFVLDVQHDGRKLVLVLPPEADREARDYRLNFRFFQRIEGSFKLTPGAVLKGMQVRVFENGARTPKLTQTLNVS